MAITLFGGVTMQIETPDYKVIKNDGVVEIREYSSMFIARTEINNGYRESTYTGFRRIANYIFGGNDQKMEISMTAPVISNSPVGNSGHYEVLFMMPKKYKLETLPQPNLSDVKLEERTLGRVAVLRFGGWATEQRAWYYHEKLEAYLKENKIKTMGNFMVAQYNSPWALPPFRRNEIIVSIEE
jgi:hypothetical protein|tara:strand:+ start:3239 stop:3790 length:552 start_codon:yes stop_codon:yes gene_type:complete